MLRAHQTMRGLTTLTPNAKQRFVQLRSALTNDEPVNNLALLEVYLQLHDSGRAEQAEELLDRFEQSCKVAMAAAAAAAAAEDEDVQAGAGEIVSPIALQVAEGLAPLAGVSDEEDEPMFSPLGGGVLFGREQFEDDYLVEDGGDGDARDDDFPVISPIAAAMGVVVNDVLDDTDFATLLADADHGADPDEDAEEAGGGFGGGLLGLGVAEGDSDEGDLPMVSPFGLSPELAETDDDDDDDGGDGPFPTGDYDPDFEFDSGRGGRGIGFYLILGAFAIALAAAIAHLTGKAFWFR